MKDQPDPRIEIDVAERDDRVLITVATTAPASRPEAAGNLFMPFKTTKEKGLGLGLVISQEIARELGGTLRLDPDSGSGASFTIDFEANCMTQGSGLVALVDDDADLLHATTQMLELAGFSVIALDAAEAALAVARQEFRGRGRQRHPHAAA